MFSFLPRLPGRSKSTLVHIIGIATHTLKKKSGLYITSILLEAEISGGTEILC